jgi:multisubunit Na+/H+ antiporter MnhE subunit
MHKPVRNALHAARRPGLYVLAAATLIGFWLLLAGSENTPELVAGIVVALIILPLSLLQTHRRGTVRVNWLRVLWSITMSILADTARLAAQLARDWHLKKSTKGIFRTISIDASVVDPAEIPSRAYLTLAISLSPNTYVVGIDESGGEITIHQLKKSAIALKGVYDSGE